jgi:hypothetical protein
MNGAGYNGGSTSGGRWGCGLAAIIGAPLFFFLLLADALGDCAPDTVCHKGFLSMVVLPTILIAAPVGLLTRWLVNRRSKNDG